MNKRVLVFATHNLNKAAEIQQLLGDTFQLKTLDDIGCFEDIPETGLTLEENAGIKSRHVFEKYGLDCFADDTGLEVAALNHEPGVFSARYAGLQKNDQDNMDLLLLNLQQHTNRSAHFRTVISLIQNGSECVFEGILPGTICKEKAGTNGFGYDPVFKPNGFDGTLAQMELADKNKISHRAIAMGKLISYLKINDQF